MASLLRGTGRLGPTSLAGVQDPLRLFIGVGLSPRLASAAASTLATFIIGSVYLNISLVGIDARCTAPGTLRPSYWSFRTPEVSSDDESKSTSPHC
ncbi:TetR/AcrR family transcriptional regulator C-terminal domain-containing protein [Streptomyces sp. NPDC006649]|uniref:TetR/AcrR family transcriptional regulator C-terminal domain-containing protein n=1 Tax=Streptomyces sp. NPDC006649 TaxID=3156896 RepID=UPI00339DC157